MDLLALAESQMKIYDDWDKISFFSELLVMN